ncbi:unnamed protein product [Parascedosporium putredinis]|uniref:G-protein coupled receptors family 2 profile 2 domain-containing protein n=1 Tax=Parascedosporium putredinis TaxID=1442378 RepID=A0A9P1H1L9_9PEZI|nr:unnamed protein product [Parascedosporium putredinis]CAI7992866.1 unnamed protein product [Parascedosporium putredinis]
MVFAANETAVKALRGACLAPFFDPARFPIDEGFVEGRLCQPLSADLTCCLPCPVTDWVYPESFNTMSTVANWLSVVAAVCNVFLLLSYAVLPVDKTHRHYLTRLYNTARGETRTMLQRNYPHDMETSTVCAASATALLFGGFAAVMWVFLRSVSLHLQICWQQNVGRMFMIFSHATGWVIPLVVVILALVFSGVSFRFGATCHINHQNSLADFWIPLLLFAGITVMLQFATFGYCIKVYLASLADSSASTEGSGIPYTNSIKTMTPRQAYRRVKRVIQLQWRGIAIVLIIVADVIFFSVVFVFQDNTVQAVKDDPSIGQEWTACLALAYISGGDRSQCLDKATALAVSQATIMAVLILLAINGILLLFLLGRWSMVLGWVDLFKSFFGGKSAEFVSVDARHEYKNDQLHLSTMSPTTTGGFKTPDYYGQTARYNVPSRSFSSPRPPTSPRGLGLDGDVRAPAGTPKAKLLDQRPGSGLRGYESSRDEQDIKQLSARGLDLESDDDMWGSKR